MNLVTGMLGTGSAYRIAHEVLEMVSRHRLVRGMRPVAGLYRTINIVIAILTLWLALSLLLMPLRMRWLKRRRFRAAGFVFSLLMISLIHFGLPLAVLFGLPVVLGMPPDWVLTGWNIMLKFMPDLTYWLLGVGLVLLGKGVFETWQIGRTYARQRAGFG
jgi:hypothetical protein